MVNIDGFSQHSLNAVNEMLYAEGQKNPLAGTCGQKEKRAQNKTARTPAQQAADKARAQASQGRNSVSSGVRSEAARKAAETRRRCKGLPTNPQPGVK